MSLKHDIEFTLNGVRQRVSVDVTKSAAENADIVIAEVNPNMPRTHGDGIIHVDDIDFLVPGLIGTNIMSAGMWGLGYVIVETRTRRLLKRMISTPMRRRSSPSRTGRTCRSRRW